MSKRSFKWKFYVKYVIYIFTQLLTSKTRLQRRDGFEDSMFEAKAGGFRG